MCGCRRKDEDDTPLARLLTPLTPVPPRRELRPWGVYRRPNGPSDQLVCRNGCVNPANDDGHVGRR